METVSYHLPFLGCDILTPYWAVGDLIYTIYFGAIAPVVLLYTYVYLFCSFYTILHHCRGVADWSHPALRVVWERWTLLTYIHIFIEGLFSRALFAFMLNCK